MGRAKPEKWFSMRTDFYGYDPYHLDIMRLSPQAVGAFFGAVAYVCLHNRDTVNGSLLRAYAGPRPKRVLDELTGLGFLTHDHDHWFRVEHEGTLWRRGNGRDRRAIPTHIRAYVMERDRYACVQCGSADDLSLDHIHPYSQGGTDEPSNLRVLCRSCNSRKGARTDGA